MIFTTLREIEQAYVGERLRWLHRRFYLYAWLIGVGGSAFGLFAAGLGLGVIATGHTDIHGDNVLAKSTTFWFSFIFKTLTVGLLYLASIYWVRRAQPGRAGTIRLIFWLFVGSHLLDFGHNLVVGLWIDPDGATNAVMDAAVTRLFVFHFLTALMIPWTVRESVLPLIPVVSIRIVLIAVLSTDPVADRALEVLILCLVGLPGMAVCWFKQRRFHRGFQYRSYRDAFQYVSREVSQARQLHESFFPAPIPDGPLRLDYAYQPMAQLGGDYLHAHVCRGGDGRPPSLFCAVIDVTGHGLSATLTANHLHALIKRQTQHTERLEPGDLIAELNRYMHESFSGLSVFATALCLRLDMAERRIVWASAGHPPGFLSHAGHFEPALASTTFLLGAVAPEDFDPAPRELMLSEGCSVIAYSDGATELPLAGGGMLGIEGMSRHITRLSSDGPLSCARVLDSLNALTAGERQDDILLVKLDFEP